eukprot:TRINITY_DN6433_c0_g1_i1.p1 TRINITY_DN6433_c0_g1~~TRINITY_DN6433_c0_g1_i1.p1  ORF type:complete len:132 (+),score=24.26 TRINITY_DN6433_c0_g1_i1:190-585(+)
MTLPRSSQLLRVLVLAPFAALVLLQGPAFVPPYEQVHSKVLQTTLLSGFGAALARALPAEAAPTERQGNFYGFSFDRESLEEYKEMLIDEGATEDDWRYWYFFHPDEGNIAIVFLFVGSFSVGYFILSLLR